MSRDFPFLPTRPPAPAAERGRRAYEALKAYAAAGGGPLEVDHLRDLLADLRHLVPFEFFRNADSAAAMCHAAEEAQGQGFYIRPGLCRPTPEAPPDLVRSCHRCLKRITVPPGTGAVVLCAECGGRPHA